MNGKEAAAKVRAEIKKNGIKASVLFQKTCGSHVVRVTVPSYDVRFTAENIRVFCEYAKVIGLTFAYGSPIDVDIEVQLVDRHSWVFYAK